MFSPVGCSLTGSGYVRATELPAAPDVIASPASTPLPATPVPSPTDTQAPPTCTETRGQIQEADIPSALLPEPLHYRIYLPPCYPQRGAGLPSGAPAPTSDRPDPQRQGFPVLYLIHGLLRDDSQWDRIGADEAADALIVSGQAPPFIIVMPYDRRATEPSQDAFGQALADELIPWIDTHYLTLPTRRYRDIGGLSRGAGWAIHLGFSRWDLFASVGAHSLAFFYEDSLQIDAWLKSTPPGQVPRAYLDIGHGDGELEGVTEFESYLTDHDVPHEWHMNNGLHEEAYWSAHFEQYLRWYTAVWWN